MADLIQADTRGMERLATALKAASPAAYKGARKGLRLAAVPVLTRARSNASYSSRIPNSGRIVVSSKLIVRVTFGGPSAPNAAPIENEGRGHVRHPTYSPRPAVSEKVGWTDKNSRPAFLEPSLLVESEQIVETVGAVVAKAVDAAVGSL